MYLLLFTLLQQDSRILDGIKWGALIVDEYQRSCMSRHHDRIKELNAHMKLLLVNSRIKVKTVHILDLSLCFDSVFFFFVPGALESLSLCFLNLNF